MPSVIDNGGADQIAEIVSQLAEALDAGSITVKLQNGREIVGPVLGFSVKRREKKGEVSWLGSVRIQVDTGELEIDCHTIEEVSAS